MELKAIDLFCGSGGFAYGMKKAGISIIRSIDLDPDVLEVHSRNLPRLWRSRGFAPFQGSQKASSNAAVLFAATNQPALQI
ncbi:site-specific DNA-cytosine methylase [Phyllobacterium trifolii]|uniref:Site-specific DNA-cytosine methylase n=1 Tax=Phyllobacterium trifolii TaxID=300193 RepID=A0A839UI45_9HYPH|nr:DNA cytosine methyltransferase [Phyllobacterium trifolii]MBB3149453.1 site-specific DNA-cytosine methylase [Phyllobacterium trifolii]